MTPNKPMGPRRGALKPDHRGPGTLRALSRTLLFAVATVGCVDEAPTPTEADLVLPIFQQEGRHYGTHMTGAEETPPRPSKAQGQLVITVEPGGASLRYRLLVANIEDVTQAHMHLAPPGFAGPPVVWLYPAAPPAQLIPGPFDGLLNEGTIMDWQVIGPLTGQGVAGLLAAIRAGQVYANVHTTEFPPGEIRGQVR